MFFCRLFILLGIVLAIVPDPAAARKGTQTIEDIFSDEHRVQVILDIEAAIARAQAAHGYIPKSAAEEIAAKAKIEFAKPDDIAKEKAIVRHGMVAALNVWRRSIAPEASEYVHYGVTTVDVYDTALAIKLRASTKILIQRLRDIELTLIDLAQKYKDTPMVGRTLGQHALPITFGKKVSTWIGENRRNIERLNAVLAKLNRCAILKGAVGTYAGLGPKAIEIERTFAKELGFDTPYPDDWHGTRDVLADYALTLSLMSKSFGHIGQELFLLQTTDIGETSETRVNTAVSSSSMPHKSNPRKSVKLIHAARVIPRQAEIILDDVINFFERDTVSDTMTVLKEISLSAGDMSATANDLLSGLHVKEDVMMQNLHKTGDYIMAQRIALALTREIGKNKADELLRTLIKSSLKQDISFRDALRSDPAIASHLKNADLDKLLDPLGYLGLASKEVDAVVAEAKKQREFDPVK